MVIVANFLLVSNSLALTQQQQDTNPYVKNMQQTFNQANSSAKVQFDKLYPKPVAPNLSGGATFNGTQSQIIKPWSAASNAGGQSSNRGGAINNTPVSSPSTPSSDAQTTTEDKSSSSSTNIFLPPGSNTSNNSSTNIFR